MAKETGVIHIVREGGLWCRLSTKEMSLAERESDHERNSVCIPYRKCRKQLGLPALLSEGDSLRLTWKLEPSKLITKVKKTQKTAAKKKRGAKR